MVLNASQWKERVERLSQEQKLAFSILLCERLLPAMEKFSMETGFNSDIYDTCLLYAWSALRKDNIKISYDSKAEYCLRSAPDTEEFRHPLTSAALNAALSITLTMRFLADNDVNHLFEIITLALDTAALYAQDVAVVPPRSLDFEEVITHPLVQQELRRQREDMEFLEALPIDVASVAPLVKKRAMETEALLPSQDK